MPRPHRFMLHSPHPTNNWSRSASPFKTPPRSQDVRVTKWSATAVCLSTRGEVRSARADAYTQSGQLTNVGRPWIVLSLVWVGIVHTI
ncbi:hypothetical protein BASA60_010861, partial [Batrachochytrium salamandrivorans]